MIPATLRILWAIARAGVLAIAVFTFVALAGKVWDPFLRQLCDIEILNRIFVGTGIDYGPWRCGRMTGRMTASVAWLAFLVTFISSLVASRRAYRIRMLLASARNAPTP